MMNDKKHIKKLQYSQHKRLLIQFISNFSDQSILNDSQYYHHHKKFKYLIQMQKISNYDSRRIEIEIQDLQAYLRQEQQKQLLQQFRVNTLRYVHLFEQIISELLPPRTKPINPQSQVEQIYKHFLREQRQDNLKHNHTNKSKQFNEDIPTKLYQNYDVCIVYGPNAKYSAKTVRQINSQNIGALVSFKAIVIRTSDIRPEILVATYVCDVCGYEIYMVLNGSAEFKPLTMCKSTKCIENGIGGQVTFLPGYSNFRSYQQLKVQQIPQQLIRGAIPKSIRLQLRGSLTNLISPGDMVSIQGIVMSKKINRVFSSDVYFQNYIHVTKIKRQKKKYSDFQISSEQKQQINNIREEMQGKQDELINNLARSIAPEIYGLENVKKALLLQMVGGKTVKTSDNLRIRGEINIALFGDPGIAKSQLLKHISYISPRAVYTTGKGSSGVGLTAAIVIDPITKQLSLEAGALVLADKGVCCIDEFDKMDEYDRTAIHEVMQQQTVSITKAGIITSLNARTAVLAAANPVFGRYNKALSTKKNLNLPAALLSRFDLIFILLDETDMKKDLQLAEHIGKVHQKKRAQISSLFDEKFLKNYISIAKTFQPIIPRQIHQTISQRYIHKRQLQTLQSAADDEYTTTRSLLAIIRLAQARAKLRFSNIVSNSDVLDCIQLIQQSQQSAKMKQQIRSKHVDQISAVFDFIKSSCDYNRSNQVNLEVLLKRCENRGYSREIVELTIKNYVNMDVLYENKDVIGLVLK